MPALLMMLVGGLATAAASMAGRVLIALGVVLVTYTGLSAGLSAVESTVVTAMGDLPARAITVLGTAKVDVCIKIILSAYAARLVLMGLQSGAVTKMVLKAG